MGKRVLMWTHGWNRSESGLRRLFRVAFYRLAHELLVNGTKAKEFAAQHGYPTNRVRVVYNSIATQEEIDTERREHPRNPIVGNVVAIGRITERKKLHLLFDAADLLRSSNTDLHLHIVGDGPLKESLESLARRRQIRATFHGAIYEPDKKSQILRSAYVSVIPGDAGLSVIDSLASGVPVITSAQERGHGPEVEALMLGSTGDFFLEGDSADLARQLLKWLQLPLEQLLSMSHQCEAIVDSSYTANRTAQLIYGALDSSLAKHAS